MLTQWNDLFFNNFNQNLTTAHHIDEYFKRLLHPKSLQEHTRWNLRKDPSFHLSDEGDYFLLLADLPNMREEDLEITANAENMVLKGQIKADLPEGYELQYQERQAMEFVRTFNFPKRIDVENIEASLKSGVLMVKISKAPEVKPKQISIKIK